MKKRIIRAALMVLAVITVLSVAFVFPSFAEDNEATEAETEMPTLTDSATEEALASDSLPEVLAGPGGGASGGGFGGGVTGQNVDIRGLVSKIAYRACAFIMAAAVIYGCWVLFEGFIDGNSTSKKKGLVTILGGTLMCGLIYTVYQMIFR